jgi:hypothetical protein
MFNTTINLFFYILGAISGLLFGFFGIGIWMTKNIDYDIENDFVNPPSIGENIIDIGICSVIILFGIFIFIASSIRALRLIKSLAN